MRPPFSGGGAQNKSVFLWVWEGGGWLLILWFYFLATYCEKNTGCEII